MDQRHGPKRQLDGRARHRLARELSQASGAKLECLRSKPHPFLCFQEVASTDPSPRPGCSIPAKTWSLHPSQDSADREDLSLHRKLPRRKVLETKHDKTKENTIEYVCSWMTSSIILLYPLCQPEEDAERNVLGTS